MDHKDALKGFRAGSSQESASGRMSLIDSFNEIHTYMQTKMSNKSKTTDEDISWSFTNVDMKHIFRVTEVILRQDALSIVTCETPFNVYSLQKAELSREILDVETMNIGQFLTKTFMCKDNLFGLSINDIPDLESVIGPKNLKSRVKKTIGVTIKWVIKQTKVVNKTEMERKEDSRSKLLSNTIKQSSELNMCQALVKPDCSKPRVQKSASMKSALIKMLELYKSPNAQTYITTVTKMLPDWVTNKVKVVTIEFAGFNFKTKVVSGSQYILLIQNATLRPIVLQMPILERIILCEEKYSFTPDNFKAGTRQQRRKTQNLSVTHLKTADEVLNQGSFQRDAITGTDAGKSLISNYLASNAQHL